MADLLKKSYHKVKDASTYAKRVRMYSQWAKDDRERLKILPQPELTQEEKQQIDAYWQQYGIKFRNYDFFRWHYGFTGVKSPRFIPTVVHGDILIKYYNLQNGELFGRAYNDKNLFYDYTPGLPLPRPILCCIDGQRYDGDGNFIRGGSTVPLSRLPANRKCS